MTDVTSSDALTSPSFLRNQDPILAVLTRVLPERGTVLEIASGSGEHAIYFAAALPSLIWQPTDLDPVALRSIAAHRATARLPNVRPPLQLDASARSWPVEHADAVVVINMLHISLWRAAEGLMAGADASCNQVASYIYTAPSGRTAFTQLPVTPPSTRA